MRKLLRIGLVPAGVWERPAVGIAPTEWLKLRRPMAAIKSTTSLSLFMEAFGLEVEEELSATAISPHEDK